MKQTWIDKNLENKRSHDHQQRIHQAKLNQIAASGQPLGTNQATIIKSQQAKAVEANLKKFKQEKKKAAQFQQSEKNIVISRENQILLSKLVDISNGKWSSVPAAQGANQNRKRTSASQNRIYQPTSLNLGVRKRETDRIERENHAFAKRLFDKRAIVEKKNLDKDYQAHLRYKRQIAKMPGGQKTTKTRAHTRGHGGTGGLSQANYMEDPDMPKQPSHYLNQGPMMPAMSQEIQPLENPNAQLHQQDSESASAMHQDQQQMQMAAMGQEQQPAASQMSSQEQPEAAVQKPQQPAAAAEESKTAAVAKEVTPSAPAKESDPKASSATVGAEEAKTKETANEAGKDAKPAGASDNNNAQQVTLQQK